MSPLHDVFTVSAHENSIKTIKPLIKFTIL